MYKMLLVQSCRYCWIQQTNWVTGEGCACLPVHPKSLPYCTVLVTDSLVKWSVGLCKGKENGKEPRWKTACHILQKWLIVQKESHLQQMNTEMHKSEINKTLWLQCYFLFSGFLLFLQSLTLPIPCDSLFTFLPCQHMVILYHFYVLRGCPIFIFFFSISSASGLFSSTQSPFDSQRNLTSPTFCGLHTPSQWTLFSPLCLYLLHYSVTCWS